MGDLALHGLTAVAGGKTLVAGIDCALVAGQVTALVGPNGGGKTSLLRAILGLVPATGGVAVGPADLSALPVHRRARHFGYLAQDGGYAWPIAVADAVALGLDSAGAHDRAAADPRVLDAMARAQCAHLADRSTAHLSGGERARVALARLLVAERPWLLADEPVAALDPAGAHHAMALLRDRAAGGVGVLVVLHDLGLAARYADRIVWVDAGAVQADTPPAPDAIAAAARQVFGVDAHFARDADGRIAGVGFAPAIASR